MSELPPSVPPPRPEGWFAAIVETVKSLTLSNVLVIALLVVALAPAYFLWRVINDEQMLYRFLSSYREVPNPIPNSNCVLREISMRGGGDTFGIATSFASLGNDRWQIGVILHYHPTAQDIEAYCETLNHIIDKMRDPTKPAPVFPGTEAPLIWPYPSNGQ